MTTGRGDSIFIRPTNAVCSLITFEKVYRSDEANLRAPVGTDCLCASAEPGW